jgi:DNA-binding transcriptional MerR regulator
VPVTSKDTPQYRIQTVAQRTGIPAATLRAWERRYGVPRPVRTETAYRTYSERDIELVEELRRLCNTGLSPAEAANQLRQLPSQESSTSSALTIVGGRETPSETQPVGTIHETVVGELVAAVRTMNVPRIEAELLHARSLGTGLQVFERVLKPALETVGDLWHDGEISIGHEHLATELITSTARDLLRLSQPAESERLALLACFADEVHASPLYGVGLRLVSWGYRVVTLGALTPPAALGPAVKRLQPTVVGLSATTTPPRARARELAEGYALACGQVPWVVGGRAAADLSELIGEFGGITAPNNLEELRELFERRVFKPIVQRRTRAEK